MEVCKALHNQLQRVCAPGPGQPRLQEETPSEDQTKTVGGLRRLGGQPPQTDIGVGKTYKPDLFMMLFAIFHLCYQLVDFGIGRGRKSLKEVT